RISTCWPAGCPGDLGTDSVRLLVRAVSWWVATASPSCQVSRPSNAVLSMDHLNCGSEATPRGPVHPARSIGDPGPTWRSSRSRDEVPAAAQAHHVGEPAVALRR